MKPAKSSIFATGLLIATAAVAGDQPHSEHHAHASPHGGLVETVGRNHLELVYDDRNGSLTIYVLDRRGSHRSAIPAEPITVEVEPVDDDGFGGTFPTVLLPLPDEGDPAGRASRFVGTDAGLIGLDRLRVTARTSLDGEPRDTVFSVEASAFHDVYVCPMRCEGGKSYDRADARCPVCGMKLVPVREAHGDHSPKHGGIFFMAPDGWHHLEGVLGQGEFRLYLYNDFTQPIPATPLAGKARISVTPLDAEGRPRADAEAFALEVDGSGNCLLSPLPANLEPPLDVELRLRFEGRDRADLFSFGFE